MPTAIQGPVAHDAPACCWPPRVSCSSRSPVAQTDGSARPRP